MLSALVRDSDVDAGSSAPHSTNPSPVGTPPRYQTAKRQEAMLSALVRESEADESVPVSSASSSTKQSPIGTPPQQLDALLASLRRDSVADQGSPVSSQSSTPSPIGTPARAQKAKQPFDIWRHSPLPKPAYMLGRESSGTYDLQHVQLAWNQSTSNHVASLPHKSAATSDGTSTVRARQRSLSPTAKPYIPDLQPSVGSSMHHQATQSPSNLAPIHDAGLPMTPPQPGFLPPFTSPSGPCSSGRAGRPTFEAPGGDTPYLPPVRYRPGTHVNFQGPPKYTPFRAPGGRPAPEDVLQEVVKENESLRSKLSSETIARVQAEKELEQARQRLAAVDLNGLDEQMRARLQYLEAENERLQAMMAAYEGFMAVFRE